MNLLIDYIPSCLIPMPLFMPALLNDHFLCSRMIFGLHID